MIKRIDIHYLASFLLKVIASEKHLEITSNVILLQLS